MQKKILSKILKVLASVLFVLNREALEALENFEMNLLTIHKAYSIRRTWANKQIKQKVKYL